jgi:pre-mRNA-splicing factor ATP-dependent RNA helicase DHX15/PRP43
LNYLGALDDEGELTKIGSIMSAFPLDPQLSKCLIESVKYNCSNEMLSIAAMLSVQNPFQRPKDKQEEADNAKYEFLHEDGDHLTLLNLYHSYLHNNSDNKWCYKNYINNRSMMQADSIRKQLEGFMNKSDLKLISTDFEDKNYYVNIRKALLSGMFMQTALLTRKSYVTIKDNQVVALHPSCGITTRPKWVLYNEFVLTTKNYIRTVTEIEGEWLIEIAPNYYDLENFKKNNETYIEIQRVINSLQKKKYLKKD